VYTFHIEGRNICQTLARCLESIINCWVMIPLYTVVRKEYVDENHTVRRTWMAMKSFFAEIFTGRQ